MRQSRPAASAPSAPPPKITGGAISGSTIIAMISPPRRLPSASDAPSPPTNAKARPPIAAVPKISGASASGAPSAAAAIGAASANGAPAAVQWARHLTAATASSEAGPIASRSSAPSSKSRSNIRSSESSEASASAIQASPPAIGARRCGSGPVANGTSVVTAA